MYHQIKHIVNLCRQIIFNRKFPLTVKSIQTDIFLCNFIESLQAILTAAWTYSGGLIVNPADRTLEGAQIITNIPFRTSDDHLHVAT